MQAKSSKATSSAPSSVLSCGSLEWTVGHIVTYIISERVVVALGRKPALLPSIPLNLLYICSFSIFDGSRK